MLHIFISLTFAECTGSVNEVNEIIGFRECTLWRTRQVRQRDALAMHLTALTSCFLFL